MISHEDPTLICCQLCFPSTGFNAYASAVVRAAELCRQWAHVSLLDLFFNPSLALLLTIASVYSRISSFTAYFPCW